MSDTIAIDILYGHRELVQVREVRDGKLWLGGYSIGYDRNGVETGRTPVSWNCALYCEGAAVDINGQIVRAH